MYAVRIRFYTSDACIWNDARQDDTDINTDIDTIDTDINVKLPLYNKLYAVQKTNRSMKFILFVASVIAHTQIGANHARKVDVQVCCCSLAYKLT